MSLSVAKETSAFQAAHRPQPTVFVALYCMTAILPEAIEVWNFRPP